MSGLPHGASGLKITREEDMQHWQDPSSKPLRKDTSPPQLQLPSFTGKPLRRICPPEVTQQQLWEWQTLPSRWQGSREGKSRSHLVTLTTSPQEWTLWQRSGAGREHMQRAGLQLQQTVQPHCSLQRVPPPRRGQPPAPGHPAFLPTPEVVFSTSS